MTTMLLSASFAAVVAIVVTISIEHLGGHRGGLIGTLPTTIVPAAIGLFDASSSTASFESALLMTPLGMLFNALFLLCWRLVPAWLPPWPSRARLALCCAIALATWGGLASGGMWAVPQVHLLGLTEWMAALGVFGVGLIIGVLACVRNPPGPSAKVSVGPFTLLSRGALAGAAIGGAVWLAQHTGPHIAGLAAVFPAIFLTTMVSLWWTHGEGVGAGAVGPMMLGGTSVSGYALVAAKLIPMQGPALGSLSAWVIAVTCITVPAWVWMNAQSARE